jgi:glycosyltransferase involved in cell wall biosynthesis
MPTPTISVIIPVYNGERYLAEALRSVLNQSLPPAAVFVVDDGSSDGSAAIAESFGPPVSCLRQPNRGAAAARNRGVAAAERADLLAFLDADDLWTPDRLRIQVAAITADPNLEAALGQVENFVSPDLHPEEQQRLAPSANRIGHSQIGALLVRRAAFLRVGWFDPRWQRSDFIDWWNRAMLLKLQHTIAPDLVLRRRLHATNMTRRDHASSREYLSLVREQLARKRQANSDRLNQPEHD